MGIQIFLLKRKDKFIIFKAERNITENILVKMQWLFKILAQDPNMVNTNNSKIFKNTVIFVKMCQRR